MKIYCDEDEWYYLRKDNILTRDTNIITTNFCGNYKCDQFDGLLKCIENEVIDEKFEKNIEFYEKSRKSENFGEPIADHTKLDIVNRYNQSITLFNNTYLNKNTLRLIPKDKKSKYITNINIKSYKALQVDFFMVDIEHYFKNPFDGTKMDYNEYNFTCFDYEGLLKCIENEVIEKYN